MSITSETIYSFFMLDLVCVCVSSLQRHTAQLREELLKLHCPDGLEADSDKFSERSAALLLKDAEKPGGSQGRGEGQL